MKLVLYCKKLGARLTYFDNHCYETLVGPLKSNSYLNGKIVAECDFEVSIHNWYNDYSLFEKLYYQENMMFNNENSCMSSRELVSYLGNNLKKDFYAIHIKNLHIFDTPKKLNEYSRIIETTYGEEPDADITKAPQNMLYCCTLENDIWKRKVLIPIKPEDLYKILNGKKTVIVSKRILKEMLDNE